MNIRSMTTLLSVLFLSATAQSAEEREITVALTVPDSAWVISIDEVREVENEIWVISTVSRDPDIMGAQVISIVKASVRFVAPNLPVKHFVIGKTWTWKNEEPYTFIESPLELEKQLRHSILLYHRAKKNP